MENKSKTPPHQFRGRGRGNRRFPINTKPAISRTYYISGDAGLPHEPLINLLNSNGFIQLHEPASHITYVHAELRNHIYDRDLYKIKCNIKNLLHNTFVITNKENLYNSMFKSFPEITSQHLAATRNLSEVNSVNPGEVLIIKPVGVGAHSGHDIFIVTNNKQLEVACLYLALKNYQSLISCTYIRDPLTLDSYKFHFRIYLLVSVKYSNGIVIKAHSIFNRGRIFTAELPYTDTDYSNKKIHDTHLASTKKNLYYPEDLNFTHEASVNVNNQIVKILTSAATILKQTVQVYQESISGYEIFGCDFMLTRDFTVMLLEINDKVGYGAVNHNKEEPSFVKFATDFYNWSYTQGISLLIS
jgi:hypothetical protein